MLRAFDRQGVEIKPGTPVLDFRGERPTFVMATRAKTTGKSGKVVLDYGTYKGEYYDSVVELEVRDLQE